MGAAAVNIEFYKDYATIDNESSIRFHIDFRIPFKKIKELENRIEADDWKIVTEYLLQNYPQCSDIIILLMAKAEIRKKGTQREQLKVA